MRTVESRTTGVSKEAYVRRLGVLANIVRRITTIFDPDEVINIDGVPTFFIWNHGPEEEHSHDIPLFGVFEIHAEGQVGVDRFHVLNGLYCFNHSDNTLKSRVSTVFETNSGEKRVSLGIPEDLVQEVPDHLRRLESPERFRRIDKDGIDHLIQKYRNRFAL